MICVQAVNCRKSQKAGSKSTTSMSVTEHASHGCTGNTLDLLYLLQCESSVTRVHYHAHSFFIMTCLSPIFPFLIWLQTLLSKMKLVSGPFGTWIFIHLSSYSTAISGRYSTVLSGVNFKVLNSQEPSAMSCYEYCCFIYILYIILHFDILYYI